MTTYDLFGPVDDVLAAEVAAGLLAIEAILLGLIVVNMVARALAHRRHVSQAEEGGAEAMSRHPFHTLTNVLLLLGGFYYVTVEHHAGMVASTIIIVLVLTDIFEFESRRVEARRDIDIDRPKAAILGSLIALMYVGYVAFFTGPLGQFL